MLFRLLGVVVDEFFDVGVGEHDLGEDLVGGGGPGEGHGIGFQWVIRNVSHSMLGS